MRLMARPVHIPESAPERDEKAPIRTAGITPGPAQNPAPAPTRVSGDSSIGSLLLQSGKISPENAERVLRMQKELYGGRVIATELLNPDFVKLAESFGAAGNRATDPQALRRALNDAFKRSGPTVIEVPVGAMTDPRSFTNLPRVRPKAL